MIFSPGDPKWYARAFVIEVQENDAENSGKYMLDKIKYSTTILGSGWSSKGLAATSFAIATVLATTIPAMSTIDNTVTVTGSSPGNTDDVTETADESVDVEDGTPAFVLTKVATELNNAALADPSTADAEVGDVITYTYTVENTGNITLEEVTPTDVHEGTGTVTIANPTSTGTDSTDDNSDVNWDFLAPGETVTWEADYTVTQADLDGQTDNDLDNTVTIAATPTGLDAVNGVNEFATTQDFDDTEEVDLADPVATLSIAKLATSVFDGTSSTVIADPDNANVNVGDVITYTYTVTNTGNVTIDDISLSDDVTAGSGADPTPGTETLLTDNAPTGDSDDNGSTAVGPGDDNGTWDSLGVGDVITFTGTYTVTQSDVDTLQ